MFMVEVYGKKARQINAQDSTHRRAYTWVSAQCNQCKESKEREVEGKKKRKKLPVQERRIEPTTLTLQGNLQGMAPVL